SGATVPVLVSSDRSCVRTWVVTSMTGFWTSALHSTCSISAPYLGSRTRSMTLALPVQLTLPGRCQSAPSKVGRGIHALLAKVGSTRVMTTKLRQPDGAGEKLTLSADARRGARPAAVAAIPAFKTSRRFISRLLLGSLCRG